MFEFRRMGHFYEELVESGNFHNSEDYTFAGYVDSIARASMGQEYNSLLVEKLESLLSIHNHGIYRHYVLEVCDIRIERGSIVTISTIPGMFRAIRQLHESSGIDVSESSVDMDLRDVYQHGL